MKQPMSLERMVASWMADAAATTVPSEQPLIDNILAATAQQRPRPRWLALLQESPMQAQAQVVVGSPNRRLLIAATLLLIAALAAVGIGAFLLQQHKPVASDDWPGFRGDATHGGVVSHGPIGNPVLAWTYTAGAPVRTSVAVLGGTAYVSDDGGTLTALDTATHAKRWSFQATAAMGGPYATGGAVYAVDGDGVIHALDGDSGTPIWASTEKVPLAADGVVSDDLLYYATPDGAVQAFDVKTGTRVWRTAVSPTPISMKAPSVAGGLLAAVDIHGFLTVLDAGTGAIRWAAQQPMEMPGTPVIAGGTVYLGVSADATTGALVALDAKDGTPRWRIDRPLAAPAILGTTGYAVGIDGVVAAIDLPSGKSIWEAHMIPGQMRTPTVSEDAVYGYTDGSQTVFALDRATGGLLWTFDIDGSDQCCIAMSKGTVYVGSDIGTVYAITGDGAQLSVGPIPTVAAPSAVPPTTEPSTAPVDLTTSIEWVATSGKTPFEPWSMDSAPDGTLWVVNSTTGFDLFSRDGTYLESWGSAGSGNGQFAFARANGDPYGRIAFAKDGSFFVLDPGNHRIQAFDAKRRFVKAWGSLGSKPGQFIDPVGIAVDADSNLAVLDDKRHVIETFTPDGDVLKTIESYPDQVGPNDGSNDLEIGPNGHFYLSMASPNEVIELDRDGTFIKAYGDGDMGSQSGAMAFDAAGRLYVTQGFDHGADLVIQVYAPDGSHLGGFAHRGAGDAELGFSNGLVVDDTGIYAVDVSGLPDFGLRSAVRKWAPIEFGAPPAAPVTPPKVAWVTTTGPSDFIPWSLAKAPDGKIWASLALTDEFAIFSPDGTYLETWGEPGNGDGQFDLRRANGDPFGMLAFAPDGSFYVLDSGNHRVQVFDEHRRFVRSWGTFGKEPGQFAETGGLVVDRDGNVVVVDNIRNVIETYKPDGTVVSTVTAFPPEANVATGPNKGANQMALGPNGDLFLGAAEPGVVIEVDRTGKLVRTWGAAGDACALSEQPNGMAWDAQGRMYLGQGPDRGDAPGILVFGSDGSCLGGFGPEGTSDGQVAFPWGIVVDDTGIYVADAGGVPDMGFRSSITKFEPLAP